MTTAILSALPEEQSSLVEHLAHPQRAMHAGRAFWRGELHGRPVVLALSGIGKVAAATTATALIERFGVARIVFTGVAGGLGDGVQVGDVVVAQDFLQHDMDASPIFPRWEVPGYGLARMPCDAALTTMLFEAASAYLTSDRAGFDPNNPAIAHRHAACAHQGLIVSGDRFVSTSAESAALRQALGAAGIESRPVWKPLPLQPIFRDAPRAGGAVAEALFAQGLCLPSGTGMDLADQHGVIAAIRGACRA